jgi:hypothetical protein
MARQQGWFALILALAIEAGALLAPDVALPADLSTDTVDARAFSHPALPGRTVVRLVPDVLAEGVIAEMGELGFVGEHLGTGGEPVPPVDHPADIAQIRVLRCRPGT